MHFWWCGFVCAHALIETKELKMKIRKKEKKLLKGKGPSSTSFSNLLGDKFIMVFSCVPL